MSPRTRAVEKLVNPMPPACPLPPRATHLGRHHIAAELLPSPRRSPGTVTERSVGPRERARRFAPDHDRALVEQLSSNSFERSTAARERGKGALTSSRSLSRIVGDELCGGCQRVGLPAWIWGYSPKMACSVSAGRETSILANDSEGGARAANANARYASPPPLRCRKSSPSPTGSKPANLLPQLPPTPYSSQPWKGALPCPPSSSSADPSPTQRSTSRTASPLSSP